jgi:hypothetical protein
MPTTIRLIKSLQMQIEHAKLQIWRNMRSISQKVGKRVFPDPDIQLACKRLKEFAGQVENRRTIQLSLQAI